MVEKKVTTMVIKVNLCCQTCQKKIKKILCKIPQIQNQIYDEKANAVTITVACCSPEKIKKKICCKGGDFIKGIEIKEPEKHKPPPSPDESKLDPPKTDSPLTASKDVPCCMECYEGYGGGPCYQGYGRRAPCYEGYRTPAPCYEAYGRPVCNSWGGRGDYGGCPRGCYMGICDCPSEKNLSACSVMCCRWWPLSLDDLRI